MDASQRRRRPLEGIRIADLTIVVAGPTATGVLGDLGAEVIKIEHIVARGDTSTALPKAPHVDEDRPYNRGNWFHDLNRSKNAITLNFVVPEARELFKRLVAVSDVVVQNFSPRVMENHGLTYHTLREVKPDIIMASLPGFGMDGPMRNRTSFGPGIEAMTGLGDLTGFPDGPPMKPGNFVTDYTAGMMAAFAIMAALHYRKRTGKGQHLELAMRDGALQFIGEPLMDYAMNGRVQSRIGNRHPAMAPHGVYPCRGEDMWVAIAVGSDDEWERLRSALGDPDWARDERFATVTGRLRHQDEIDPHLSEWTKQRSHYAAMHTLQASGIDAGAVLTTKEIGTDPHYDARQFMQPVYIPEAGPVRLSRQGFKLSETPGEISAGPNFAAGNHYVFHDLLGLNETQLADLEAKQAIAWKPVTQMGRI